MVNTDQTAINSEAPAKNTAAAKPVKEKLSRVCLMLNKRTLDKVNKVQKSKNFNTRTAAVVEIINSYQI